MGGGGGTHTTAYETERVAPDSRAYGEKPKTFSYAAGGSTVDAAAYAEDLANYNREIAEIAEYEAKEERRKEAPDNLTGTQGQVDYTLAIDGNGNETDTTTTKKKKAAVDVNVNASNQSLGIAQDG